MNFAIFWLYVRTSNPSTFSMMKSRVQSASSNFCPQVMSQDVQGELEWCIDVMILSQVVEIQKILTSFGVGGHCLMASGKLMKFAFSQSLSTWTEDVGGMGIPTMDNDKEPRYAQMGKEKVFFRECPFWSKAAQSARERLVKYIKSSERMNGRSTFAKQWLCWRVVMEKACCGLSCPKEDPPCQLGLLLLASLDTYCRRWLSAFFPRFQAGCPVLGFQSGLWCLRATQTRWWVWEWRTSEEPGWSVMQPCEFAGHHTKDVNCPAGASKPIFLAQCVRLSTHAWLDCHARPGLIGFPTRVGFRT